jgi:hypothetical protein
MLAIHLQTIKNQFHLVFRITKIYLKTRVMSLLNVTQNILIPILVTRPVTMQMYEKKVK